MKLTTRILATTGVVLAILVAAASPAFATWSVVGVDPDTNEVGVAIASCAHPFVLGDLDVPLSPVVLVPGIGSGVSQAEFNESAPAEIARVLQQDLGAQAALDAVTASAFDDRSSVRQHAVVTLAGDSVAFTGAETLAVAGDRARPNVSAQGNILASERVLDDAIAAFEATEGELANRLVAALQAGADAGGDSRCGDQTALFAHVSVAAPGDTASGPSILLTFAVDKGSDNPVDLLSQAWADGQRSVVSDTSSLPAIIWIVPTVVLALVALVVALIVKRFRRRGSRA